MLSHLSLQVKPATSLQSHIWVCLVDSSHHTALVPTPAPFASVPLPHVPPVAPAATAFEHIAPRPAAITHCRGGSSRAHFSVSSRSSSTLQNVAEPSPAQVPSRVMPS